MTRNRRAMRLLGAPLALATSLGMAVALTAGPAQASSTSKSDPAGDHEMSSSANLDLAKVSMKTKGKQKIQITFGLHNDVTADELVFPGGLGVDFQIAKKSVRAVHLFSRDGVLESNICTYDTRKEQFPPPTKCRTLPFTQVDGKTFRVELKRKHVKKGAKVLKWKASAFAFTSGAVDPLGSATKPFTWRL
ncbi:hypothetical protein [Nocardioides campestrisoli]|uniref:hypothetical protein n=1 Tax=Nocardioides campestrisoli TaxID=2736757 RepID=UPI0015E671F7|nr:hypothetical protein [Nocardioides campestrisoli]